MKMRVYVVLPIYNEREYLEDAVRITESVLKNSGVDYQIILAEDASTDGSYEICQELAENDPNIIHIHSEKKLGRGNALKRIVKYILKHNADEFPVFVYLDADLSTHPRYIKPAIEKIVEGYDIVIGSRWKKGARVDRGLKRKFFSWGYNFFINILFNTGIKDHQCGFKVFNLNTCADILISAQDDKWFWDTEVLIRAKWKGLKVYEMPIEWKESKRNSKVNVLKDTFEMGISAIRFRLKTLKGGDY